MPRLLPPSTDVHASFLTAMKEFQAEGRGGAADSSARRRGHATGMLAAALPVARGVGIEDAGMNQE